ncbi:hypothetical protein DPMN_050089 [Dreissena polymorpha]|uniref:Uncharacterized protein n=1 Tax=Dreissena polymorpha TaxID=45954 RepID=A0A9D4HNX6_DREPO|nr:hypothetical protein DPMN_050089 [Dreissena polymorpha]
MHTSMFLSIPTTGSTCASPFEARSTSFGLCHLGWQPPHEFLPNSWLQSVHTSGFTGFFFFSISTTGFYTSSIVNCFFGTQISLRRNSSH